LEEFIFPVFHINPVTALNNLLRLGDFCTDRWAHESGDPARLGIIANQPQASPQIGIRGKQKSRGQCDETMSESEVYLTSLAMPPTATVS
jgi:hypothetical protein